VTDIRELGALAVEHGWDADMQLNLVLNYIDAVGETDGLVAFLNDFVAAECRYAEAAPPHETLQGASVADPLEKMAQRFDQSLQNQVVTNATTWSHNSSKAVFDGAVTETTIDPPVEEISFLQNCLCQTEPLAGVNPENGRIISYKVVIGGSDNGVEHVIFDLLNSPKGPWMEVYLDPPDAEGGPASVVVPGKMTGEPVFSFIRKNQDKRVITLKLP
jgi:hypothetical protein